MSLDEINTALEIEDDGGQPSYRHTYNRTTKSRFNRGRKTADSRGKAWTLTLEAFERLITLPCSYCGGSLLAETGCGLDRIDNNRGYTIKNVVPCCGSCNQIRNRHLTYDEMCIAMRAVLEYRNHHKLLSAARDPNHKRNRDPFEG